MLGPEMHAYERDLHLILTSLPWSLYGSALMETALKPKLRPSSFPPPWSAEVTRTVHCAGRERSGAKLRLL